jgi:hypothetical protein
LLKAGAINVLKADCREHRDAYQDGPGDRRDDGHRYAGLDAI